MKHLLLCLALLTTFLSADPARWATRGIKTTEYKLDHVKAILLRPVLPAQA